MKKLLIDMDGVLVDFNSSQLLKDWDGKGNPSAMYESGFFEELNPLPGALKSVHDLLCSNLYDIYICTQPLAKNVSSYTEKAAWIGKYLPDLVSKIIMCQDKSMVKGDILIDDNEKWASFGGEFIKFDITAHSYLEWNRIVRYLINKEN